MSPHAAAVMNSGSQAERARSAVRASRHAGYSDSTNAQKRVEWFISFKWATSCATT